MVCVTVGLIVTDDVDDVLPVDNCVSVDELDNVTVELRV